MKKLIAVRVAAELNKENDVDVQLVKGGVLELSVHIDRQKVIKTNPLWYPLPGKLVNQVRGLLHKP